MQLMQMIKRPFAFVLLLFASTTCGPDTPAGEPVSTWMLGTWSSEWAGQTSHNCALGYLRFEEDGSLLKGHFDCQNDQMVFTEEYQWERDDDNAVIVHFRDEDYWDGWRITLGDPNSSTEKLNCNTLRVVNILHGVPEEDFPFFYVRGEVCVKTHVSCPEDVGNCESHEFIWCGEPPPSCADGDLPCDCP